ncbi:hypothetical protein BD289DRAFT_378913 [Coniella lustricola]|uniref:Uncharacterized protein n=1 Tax=Coniella lustricola TaxID=2025994 RepID=A0A2T2ZTE2_9PEZI|nr:hypothetical protein BD289DRAFT_378913 [Coniella lustricola]
MAFHQQTRHFSQRVVRLDSIESETQPRAAAQPLRQSRDESNTWVLFSPATDASTSISYLSSAQDEQPTPGRSRISDLGSLETIAHSDNLYSEPAHSDVIEEDDAGEDDAELDSLDSHLADFTQSTPIVPGHDGLGSFRLDTRMPSADMQEQMYQFEQYNPRRVKRRRESMELGQMALEQEEAQDAARRQRIEEWRLDQSRILLQEIHKATRRRRESTVSALTSQLQRASQVSGDHEADEATISELAPDAAGVGAEWHDQDAPELTLGTGEGDESNTWSRFTRKVIHDLMGIDDKLLCVLFGEALPDELGIDLDDLSTTPRASTSDPALLATENDDSWQLRVLDRIAREFGQLVNHLSAHPHPGAFSTYSRIQQQPLPYAGLPVIPEVSTTPPGTRMNLEDRNTSMLPGATEFHPTVNSIPRTQPIDITGSSRHADPSAAANRSEAQAAAAPAITPASGTFTQQEWEQDLDIKLIFRYLRNRFTSRAAQPLAPSHSHTHSQSHAANVSPDIAATRAAARVRQHHPLVHHQRRKSFKATSGSVIPSAQVVHHHGSCASQSTRRSAGRRGSLSVSSSRHSSRHYWDIGAGPGGGAGSIASGSLIASTGPMGSWGEV